MASRPVPSRPSLAFDRKQAKALLNAVRAGDARAAERFRVHHPGFSPGETDGIARAAGLHDAQLVIAREYGLPSWPRWKRFVETRRLDTRERAAELLPRRLWGGLEMLITAGARLPGEVGGSELVQDVLRRHGVPDAE